MRHRLQINVSWQFGTIPYRKEHLSHVGMLMLNESQSGQFCSEINTLRNNLCQDVKFLVKLYLFTK